jgi:hypothetical protein
MSKFVMNFGVCIQTTCMLVHEAVGEVYFKVFINLKTESDSEEKFWVFSPTFCTSTLSSLVITIHKKVPD